MQFGINLDLKSKKQKDKQGPIKWISLVVFSKLASFEIIFISHLHVSQVRLPEMVSKIDFQRNPEAVEYNLTYLCYTPYNIANRIMNRNGACRSYLLHHKEANLNLNLYLVGSPIDKIPSDVHYLLKWLLSNTKQLHNIIWICNTFI